MAEYRGGFARNLSIGHVVLVMLFCLTTLISIMDYVAYIKGAIEGGLLK